MGGDVDTEKVLVSNKIFLGEKNCKYLIGYLYDDNEVNYLHRMLPKMSAYVKSYNGQRWWLIKKIILFGIKSVLILKRTLIASLSTIKNFWKPK